jgi:short-subunit dehydrogenase
MNKVAVITGSSQGLGEALARKLAHSGYSVVLVARTQSKLEQVAEKITTDGGIATVMPTDITDATAVAKLAEKVKEKFGKIDFLINNAAVFTTEIIENISPDQIKHDLDVSLFGSILCTHEFMPLMKPGGKILFISSAFGIMGAAGYSVYNASKAGIINFAEAIRREVKNRKIKIHVATPADIDTPAFREEEEKMPDWMKMAKVRPTPLSAKTAAKRILKQCRGNRFFIFSDFSIRGLYLMKKFLPKQLSDYILDSMFPHPK